MATRTFQGFETDPLSHLGRSEDFTFTQDQVDRHRNDPETPFDIDYARSKGFSDAEVAEYLGYSKQDMAYQRSSINPPYEPYVPPQETYAPLPQQFEEPQLEPANVIQEMTNDAALGIGEFVVNKLTSGSLMLAQLPFTVAEITSNAMGLNNSQFGRVVAEVNQSMSNMIQGLRERDNIPPHVEDGSILPSPREVMGVIIEAIPQALGAYATVGRLGMWGATKGLQKYAPKVMAQRPPIGPTLMGPPAKLGLGTRAVQKAPQAIAGMATSGTLGGGQIYNEAKQDALGVLNDLNQNLFETGAWLTPDQVNHTATKVAQEAFTLGMPVSTVLGIGLAPGFNPAVGRIRRALITGLTESLTEGLEEPAQGAIIDNAMRSLDESRDPADFRKRMKEFWLGFFAGGSFGTVTGLTARRDKVTPRLEEEGQDLTPEGMGLTDDAPPITPVGKSIDRNVDEEEGELVDSTQEFDETTGKYNIVDPPKTKQELAGEGRMRYSMTQGFIQELDEISPTVPDVTIPEDVSIQLKEIDTSIRKINKQIKESTYAPEKDQLAAEKQKLVDKKASIKPETRSNIIKRKKQEVVDKYDELFQKQLPDEPRDAEGRLKVLTKALREQNQKEKETAIDEAALKGEEVEQSELEYTEDEDTTVDEDEDTTADGRIYLEDIPEDKRKTTRDPIDRIQAHEDIVNRFPEGQSYSKINNLFERYSKAHPQNRKTILKKIELEYAKLGLTPSVKKKEPKKKVEKKEPVKKETKPEPTVTPPPKSDRIPDSRDYGMPDHYMPYTKEEKKQIGYDKTDDTWGTKAWLKEDYPFWNHPENEGKNIGKLFDKFVKAEGKDRYAVIAEIDKAYGKGTTTESYAEARARMNLPPDTTETTAEPTVTPPPKKETKGSGLSLLGKEIDVFDYPTKLKDIKKKLEQEMIDANPEEEGGTPPKGVAQMTSSGYTLWNPWDTYDDGSPSEHEFDVKDSRGGDNWGSTWTKALDNATAMIHWRAKSIYELQKKGKPVKKKVISDQAKKIFEQAGLDEDTTVDEPTADELITPEAEALTALDPSTPSPKGQGELFTEVKKEPAENIQIEPVAKPPKGKPKQHKVVVGKGLVGEMTVKFDNKRQADLYKGHIEGEDESNEINTIIAQFVREVDTAKHGKTKPIRENAIARGRKIAKKLERRRALEAATALAKVVNSIPYESLMDSSGNIIPQEEQAAVLMRLAESKGGFVAEAIKMRAEYQAESDKINKKYIRARTPESKQAREDELDAVDRKIKALDRSLDALRQFKMTSRGKIKEEMLDADASQIREVEKINKSTLRQLSLINNWGVPHIDKIFEQIEEGVQKLTKAIKENRGHKDAIEEAEKETNPDKKTLQLIETLKRSANLSSNEIDVQVEVLTSVQNYLSHQKLLATRQGKINVDVTLHKKALAIVEEYGDPKALAKNKTLSDMKSLAKSFKIKIPGDSKVEIAKKIFEYPTGRLSWVTTKVGRKYAYEKKKDKESGVYKGENAFKFVMYRKGIIEKAFMAFKKKMHSIEQNLKNKYEVIEHPRTMFKGKPLTRGKKRETRAKALKDTVNEIIKEKFNMGVKASQSGIDPKAIFAEIDIESMVNNDKLRKELAKVKTATMHVKKLSQEGDPANVIKMSPLANHLGSNYHVDLDEMIETMVERGIEHGRGLTAEAEIRDINREQYLIDIADGKNVYQDEEGNIQPTEDSVSGDPFIKKITEEGDLHSSQMRPDYIFKFPEGTGAIAQNVRDAKARLIKYGPGKRLKIVGMGSLSRASLTNEKLNRATKTEFKDGEEGNVAPDGSIRLNVSIGGKLKSEYEVASVMRQSRIAMDALRNMPSKATLYAEHIQTGDMDTIKLYIGHVSEGADFAYVELKDGEVVYRHIDMGIVRYYAMQTKIPEFIKGGQAFLRKAPIGPTLKGPPEKVKYIKNLMDKSDEDIWETAAVKKRLKEMDQGFILMGKPVKVIDALPSFDYPEGKGLGRYAEGEPSYLKSTQDAINQAFTRAIGIVLHNRSTTSGLNQIAKDRDALSKSVGKEGKAEMDKWENKTIKRIGGTNVYVKHPITTKEEDQFWEEGQSNSLRDVMDDENNFGLFTNEDLGCK